jgi:hypothetical protein
MLSKKVGKMCVEGGKRATKKHKYKSAYIGRGKLQF